MRYSVGAKSELRFIRSEGNIGYALGGIIPLRSKSALCCRWTDGGLRTIREGYIPFEELPRLIQSESEGVIATARQSVAVRSHLPHITLSISDELPYCISRIEQLFTAKKFYSPGDMAAMHMDVLAP